MKHEPPKARLIYHGVSPWEIEVIYSYLHSRFKVIAEEIEATSTDFASALHINIPVAFSEEFFEWFDFRRWENVKALLKEMKRRRGRDNAIIVSIRFEGIPTVEFVLDATDRQWYNNALEKIDFVLELIPYHMETSAKYGNVSKMVYRFDENKKRWRLVEVVTDSGEQHAIMDQHADRSL